MPLAGCALGTRAGWATGATSVAEEMVAEEAASCRLVRKEAGKELQGTGGKC